MMRVTLLALASLSLPLIAGCETQPRQAISPGFGNAVQHNIAVQLVNPDPPPVTEPSSLDGQRAADALERYRADEVIPPFNAFITRFGAAPTQKTVGSYAPTTPQ